MDRLLVRKSSRGLPGGLCLVGKRPALPARPPESLAPATAQVSVQVGAGARACVLGRARVCLGARARALGEVVTLCLRPQEGSRAEL